MKGADIMKKNKNKNEIYKNIGLMAASKNYYWSKDLINDNNQLRKDEKLISMGKRMVKTFFILIAAMIIICIIIKIFGYK